MNRRLYASLVAAAGAALLVTACASPIAHPGGDGGVSFDPPAAPPASGEVLGTGTVLQQDGGPAMFCLGAVAESYPPQCSGPDITNWTWDDVEGSESANGTTWGAYALQGEWNGRQFTVTAPPIMLALYDPMVQPDPLDDPTNAGDNDEAALVAVQDALASDTAVPQLSSWTSNGYLFVTVIYDDGSLQDYVDDVHGEGVVAIRSALRPVGQ
jgi:hypothetical protein